MLRRARVAVSAIFFLTGAAAANWAVRIPAVQERLGLSDRLLGFALLGVSMGALLAMPLAGALVARYGSRRITRLAALAFAVTLVAPPLAANYATLLAVLVALGMANGVLDVAMNAHAAAVQRRYASPIMTRVHALYSFGGLVGAVVGGHVAAQGVRAGPHLLAVAITVAVAATAVSPALLPSSVDAVGAAKDRVNAGDLSVAPVRLLGIIAFCVLFGEGAMANWSAVYLREIGGAGPGLAALGFASFSLMMAIGRAVGDTLIMRIGAVRLVRSGALVATAGMTAAIVVPHPWAVIAGFGAVGAGFSAVFPTVLASAARSGSAVAGTAIAGVAMWGYAGLLAGPPVIGAVSGALTLRGGLALVAVLGMPIVLFARVVSRPAADLDDRLTSDAAAMRTAA